MTIALPVREWGEGPEGDADVLAYINETPALLSLLYDLDLMPEQHPDHESEAWDRIFKITNHFREALRAAVAETKEEAAKVCDEGVKWTPNFPPNSQRVSTETARLLAKAIRALVEGK